MEDKIPRAVPSLEIYNSHFTNNYGDWALGFCGGIHGKDNACSFSSSVHHSLENITSLDLSDRCIHDLSSETFCPFKMPSLSYLNLRGNPLEQNSVTELLKLLKGFSGLLALEVDIPGPLGRSAVEILEALPNLSQLNGVTASKVLETRMHVIDAILQPRLPEIDPNDPLADHVISAMWLYLMTYRLADKEKIDETSVWYVMDELGSALRHSDVPNFRVSPFFCTCHREICHQRFSVLWPTERINNDLPGLQLGSIPHSNFLFRSSKSTASNQSWRVLSLSPVVWILPQLPSLIKKDAHILRVYTDIPQVKEFLTRPEFVLSMV